MSTEETRRVQNAWSIEGELKIPGAVIQLCTLQSNQAEDVIVLQPDHIMGLSISPMPRYSQGRYHPDMPTTKLADFGRLVFRPANVPLQSRHAGGPHHTIRCVFDKTHFDSLADLDADWDGWKLSACLDVRGTRIPEMLLRLADEVTTPGFGSAVMAEGITMTMAIEFARYLRRGVCEESEAGGLASWQIRRVTESLQTAGSKMPCVGEIAALCGISRGHLMRSFKKTTGRTLHQHIEDIRVSRAKTLLCDSRASLKEIANMLGFSGASSFSVAFRRVAGVPPAAFRRRYSNQRAPD
jgi:AraC family transcriptional regulator